VEEIERDEGEGTKSDKERVGGKGKQKSAERERSEERRSEERRT